MRPPDPERAALPRPAKVRPCRACSQPRWSQGLGDVVHERCKPKPTTNTEETR